MCKNKFLKKNLSALQVFLWALILGRYNLKSLLRHWVWEVNNKAWLLF